MVTIIQGDYAKITARLSRTFKAPYFDFNFSFTDENEVFREINRFVWESKHLMTRFKNRTFRITINLYCKSIAILRYKCIAIYLELYLIFKF